MSISRLSTRLVPLAFVAVFIAACGSEPQKPAVDAKLLESRMTQIVDALVKSENPDVKVTAAGAVKVETKDDGSVTGVTPKLTVKGKDGESTDIDPFTIKFSRGDNADSIPFEVTIPSSVTPKDKDGKVLAEVKIGSQTMKGVWRDDLQTVDKLNFKLANVAITPKDNAGKGTMDEFSMTGGLEDKGGGKFDAKYSGRMAGFLIDDPAQKSVVKMGEISFRGNMIDAKLKDYAAAAKAAGYTLSNPEIFKMWTSGKIDDKTLAFLKRMPEFMGAIDYGYSVKDISATENGKPMFALAKADVGFGLKAEGADKATASVSMSFGGIKADGADGKPILPPEADISHSGFNVDVAGLPAKELWSIYMQLLPQIQQASLATATGTQSAATEAAMSKITEEAMGKFTAALQTAKLAVNLRKMDLITPTLVMGGDGAASVDMSANPLPTGKFAFRFSGVEALSDAMAKRGKNDEMAQQVLGGLMGLKALAKPDPKAAAGKPGYLIEVEITKDGGVLANGQKLM
jgi:hypothetical protein